VELTSFQSIGDLYIYRYIRKQHGLKADNRGKCCGNVALWASKQQLEKDRRDKPKLKFHCSENGVLYEIVLADNSLVSRQCFRLIPLFESCC
jgi:hypothetical protein